MREIPLALLGFGKVGQALGRLLEDKAGFEHQGVRLRLACILDSSGAAVGSELGVEELVAAKRAGSSVADHPQWGHRGFSADEALDLSPDVLVVDATPTEPDSGGPGLGFVRRSLERGHSVVLASKGPLVADFKGLMGLAREKGCRIGFSAAVGTPLPSLEAGLISLHGCTLGGFRGLFNETSNRILRDLENGVALEEALANARQAGVLEADPRLDLEGWDTAFKVLILARSFWSPSLELDGNDVEGITNIAAEELTHARARGLRIRLVGSAIRAKGKGVRIGVGPHLLAPDDPLYSLGPGEKAAVFETDLMGRFVIRSGKAGPFATAAALVKDILNIVAHPQAVAL